MLKPEREYDELYSNIPNNLPERLKYIFQSNNFKKAKDKIIPEMERIKNIKWNKISYTIYLLPKATPRPRLCNRSGTFYVKGAHDNKKIFENSSYFPIPSSMKPVEKICAEFGLIRPTSKPDWDNVAKAYCDMCQGFLLYDDYLVVEGVSKKFYSVKPRIEITIEYMDDYDSEFNEKKIKKG